MTDLKPDLPDGVIGPYINDEYNDVDSILYTLTFGRTPTTRNSSGSPSRCASISSRSRTSPR